MMIYFEALGLLAVFAILIVGLIIGLSVVLRQPVMVTLISLVMSVAAIAAAGFLAWIGWQAIVVKQVCVISSSPTLVQAMVTDICTIMLTVVVAAAVGCFVTLAIAAWYADSWKQNEKYQNYVKKHYGDGAVKDAWKHS